jgi:hypothetical protein
MHENREISCASCRLQQDRSVKAINHDADVNVQEKSDCAVVPVNRPNKEGNLRRRSGREGRRQRRTAFSHACPGHRAGAACHWDWTVCDEQHR